LKTNPNRAFGVSVRLKTMIFWRFGASEPEGQVLNRHAGDSEPEGQVLNRSGGDSQPEGQVLNRSGGDSQPEGQVLNRSAGDSEPEGQVLNRHTGASQPEGQVLNQHAGDSQPEGQVLNRRAGDSQPEGQVPNQRAGDSCLPKGLCPELPRLADLSKRLGFAPPRACRLPGTIPPRRPGSSRLPKTDCVPTLPTFPVLGNDFFPRLPHSPAPPKRMCSKPRHSPVCRKLFLPAAPSRRDEWNRSEAEMDEVNVAGRPARQRRTQPPDHAPETDAPRRGRGETSVLRPAPLPGCMVLLPGEPVVSARCARFTTG
jgi:hypothetical protein